MEMSRRVMYQFCREAHGSGGYHGEGGGYFAETIQCGPHRYLAGYRTMFGRDVSTLRDASAYLPRLMMARVYPPGGKPVSQNINSKVQPDAEATSVCFALVPDEYKPAVLWNWNLEAGGDPLKPDLAKLGRINPVDALVHYPLDLAPRPPGEILPLAWEAPDLGHYTFRNAWAGADDIVFQVLGRQRPNQGWGGPDAGAVRLLGFGKVWGAGNEEREARRWLESVVNFPGDDRFTLGRPGRVTRAVAGKDGSGAVTIDLTDLYYDKSLKSGLPRFEKNGFRWEGTAKPLMTAVRSVAVDYSGRCGAPMLLAIADRFEGPGEKVWTWQVPDANAVKAAPGGFTVEQDGASLAATFLAPRPVEIAASAAGVKTTKSAGNRAGSEMTIQVQAVTARAADAEDGRFLVVMTLQRGAAPPVAVSGEGLSATARVGGRTVRFDGRDVSIGD
jgi:hypothetical protein